MSRATAWMLALIVVAVLAAGCAKPFATTGGRLRAFDHGFEVDLPQGWYWESALLPVKVLQPGMYPSVADGPVRYYWLQPQGEYALDPHIPEDSPLFLTRDGFLLQIIGVGRRPRDKPLPNSGKVLGTDAPLQSVSEAVTEDIRANAELRDLEVVESTTARVGGQPGFRLDVTWKTREGLRMTQRRYGVLDGPWMYQLIYQAAARYYFDRDLPTFEQVVASFRLESRAR